MWPQAAPRGGPFAPMSPPPQPMPLAPAISTEALLVARSEGTLSSPESSPGYGFKDSFARQLVCVGMAMVVAAVLGSVLTLIALMVTEPGEVTGATFPLGELPGIKVPSGGRRTFRTTRGAVTAKTAATEPVVFERQFKVFSLGKLYYRSAYMEDDGDYLFVGAMDRLYKLRLRDIGAGPVKMLLLRAAEQSVADCRVRGGDQLGTDVDCRNHIREVHPIRDGSTLYICGSNSRSPTDWQVRAEDLSIVPEAERVPIMESNQTGKAVGRCSNFVSQDSCSLWLDDAPEAGISSVVSVWHQAQGRHSIYRAAIPDPGRDEPRHSFLKTDDADASVLSEPHTVGAMSFGTHAYFVFRENAAERRACGVRVVSAIARVCKNDLGGDPRAGRRAQLWTSYIKVRLRCTDFIQFPDDSEKGTFIFQEIHASSWLSDFEGGVLFGAFTTVTHGYPDSAVCAFRRKDIDRAFSGTSFMQVSLSRDVISRVVRTNSSIYTGASTACGSDSRTLNPAEANFLLTHPLLAESPKQRHDRAFYTLPGEEFRAMVAFVFKNAWGSWLICYVATATGLLVKLAEEIVPGGATPAPAQRVDSFKLPTEGVHKLLASVEQQSLYVFSDDDILQYRMDDCVGRHPHCAPCVRDPFCGWDGTRCLPHSHGLQDVRYGFAILPVEDLSLKESA